MKKPFLYATVIFLAFAHTGVHAQDSDQQSAAEKDRQQTMTQGVLAGCAAAALVSDLAGSDDKEDLLKACLGGALVGGIYANHVANKKAEYRDQEAYFQAVIDNAEVVTAEAAAENQRIRGEIDKIKLEQEQAKKNTLAFLTKAIETATQTGKTQQLITDTRTAIASVTDEIEIQQTVLAEQRAEAPATLVAASEEAILALEAEARALQILEAELLSIDDRRAR